MDTTFSTSTGPIAYDSVGAGHPIVLLEFSLLFGLWNAIEVGAYFAVVVWLISRGTTWLHRPRFRRRLEQVTGIVLIGFGIRLATEAR